MSFLTKFRKKKGPEEPKKTPQPPKEVVEPTAMPPTPEVVEVEDIVFLIMFVFNNNYFRMSIQGMLWKLFRPSSLGWF